MRDAVHVIFAKYNTAIHAVGGSVIQRETAQLALHLALEECAAQTAQQAAATVDQRLAESNAAQLARLNEWLAEHAPALYASPDDTATCVLKVMELAPLDRVSRWLDADLSFDPGHFSGLTLSEAVVRWMEMAKAKIAKLEQELATVRSWSVVPPLAPPASL